MINTLSIARELSTSGVKREQAEAIANVVADAVNQRDENLATKDFVRNQISIVRGDISDLRGDTNAQISDLRGEISDLRGDTNAQISDLRGEISDLRGDVNTQISDLRGDVNTQISDLRGDMSGLRGDMNAQISALETRLVRWIVATGLVVAGLLITVVTVFQVYQG